MSGFQINGVDLEDLCEVESSSVNLRDRASFGTNSNFLINEHNWNTEKPDEQLVKYYSGYRYSELAPISPFKINNSTVSLCSKGYRPYYSEDVCRHEQSLSKNIGNLGLFSYIYMDDDGALKMSSFLDLTVPLGTYDSIVRRDVLGTDTIQIYIKSIYTVITVGDNVQIYEGATFIGTISIPTEACTFYFNSSTYVLSVFLLSDTTVINNTENSYDLFNPDEFTLLVSAEEKVKYLFIEVSAAGGDGSDRLTVNVANGGGGASHSIYALIEFDKPSDFGSSTSGFYYMLNTVYSETTERFTVVFSNYVDGALDGYFNLESGHDGLGAYGGDDGSSFFYNIRPDDSANVQIIYYDETVIPDNYLDGGDNHVISGYKDAYGIPSGSHLSEVPEIPAITYSHSAGTYNSGAGGSASRFGDGGDGGASSSNGVDASGYGSGGGGAGGGSSGSPLGGSGGNGFIKFYY